MRHCAFFTLCALSLTGCSSSPQTKAGSTAPSGQGSASSNPVAKYIEVSGFRISEKKPGTLTVRFVVTNHSDADIGNIEMTVNLRATTNKPTDPPMASFTAHVDGLGPQELKDAIAEIPTALRAYELPDWQFLTADFQVADRK